MSEREHTNSPMRRGGMRLDTDDQAGRPRKSAPRLGPHKRPTSITVVCKLLIGLGVVSTLGLVITALRSDPATLESMANNSRLPIVVHYLFSIASVSVLFVAGTFMLEARGWARTLWVSWKFFAFALGLATSRSTFGAALIPGLLFFGVTLLVLFRPAANAFFQAEASAPAPGE